MEFLFFLILFIGFLILLYAVVKALNERGIQGKPNKSSTRSSTAQQPSPTGSTPPPAYATTKCYYVLSYADTRSTPKTKTPKRPQP